jgi:hypothetical protein
MEGNNMQKRFITGVLLATLSGAVWSATDPNTLLSDDQKSIQDATEAYHQAVLHHGAASDDAKKAMDKMDAAKNQYQVDQLRVQELNRATQGTATSTGTTTTR